jgi:hypothetical protein
MVNVYVPTVATDVVYTGPVTPAAGHQFHLKSFERYKVPLRLLSLFR